MARGLLGSRPMETVPVTLGAVLPGTTVVPPLFGSPAGPRQSRAGAFFQALQNVIAAGIGGTKCKKINDVVPENGPSRTKDEAGNSSLAVVSEPLVIPIPI